MKSITYKEIKRTIKRVMWIVKFFRIKYRDYFYIPIQLENMQDYQSYTFDFILIRRV